MESREDLIACGRNLADRKLIWGHSGNISMRTQSDSFLISAGGSDLNCLRQEDLVLCRIKSDSWEGTRRPSMETGMHRGIYHNCEDAKAVIHSQPFYSTLIACSDVDIRPDCLPEAMAYLGQVVRVPYYHAGSQALAEAVAVAAQSGRVLLLNNHGVVCFGSSLDECLLATETLEFVSRLLVISHSAGAGLNYLGKDVMEGFLRHLKSIGRL
ncbi:MAG: class II aldolase/adducin family protein [Dehalococcoidia bacterium]|nr:class II aldolase/adducin family protein [Dehalococcoidia bacterium]